MTNGYVITRKDGFWRLNCGGKLLAKQFNTKDEAKAAAEKKPRCAPPENLNRKTPPPQTLIEKNIHEQVSTVVTWLRGRSFHVRAFSLGGRTGRCLTAMVRIAGSKPLVRG